MKSETKQCQNCKNSFILDQDDVSFYEKIDVASPSFCPKCRRIRRLAWRNDWMLYSRECYLCKKNFISIYASNKGFNVLCPKCFHSDAWDPYQYGEDYDETRSFVEQAVEVYKKTPALGIVNDNDIGSINCLYTNDFAFSKNCAMTFIAWRVENVFNSVSLSAGKDLSDCLGIMEECQYTYDAVMSGNVANSKSVYWCSSCVNCALCYDCRGCQDCFMSSGLRNKKYFFKNKEYSKEEYENIVASYKLDTRTGYKKAKSDYIDFVQTYPRKFTELRSSVNCSGSDIVRGKNVKSSNLVPFSEDSKYIHNGVSFKMCYDCEVGGETELAYECITPDQSYKSLATIECWKNNNIAYSFDCHSSNNILGCTGIKKGEYCVLNKRYSKEQYQKLYEKIIIDMKSRGEWGEFFPSSLSPFGINETRGFKQLDISKEEAIRRGYNWQDSIQETKGKETIAQENVPDSIVDVSDTITNEILACITCQRNYKILPDELLLYRRLSVPIPERCFFCRHEERESMRGGYDLIERQCDCKNGTHDHSERCEEVFETFFTQKERRPIYCEKCYQQELL